jgi:tetratricopeptide (TPR) repeat protein
MRVGLVIFILVAVASSAWPAPELSVDGKACLDRGLREFNILKYDEARAELEHCYEVEPNPVFLYAIAQAYRNLHRCDKAISLFEAYLRTSPAAREEALARRNIERCQAEVTQPVVPPVVTQSPPASPAENPIAPAKPATPWLHDRTGHALFWSGLGAVITGSALGGVGRSDADNTNAARTYGQFADGKGTGNALQIAGIITGTIGGALILGGVIRFAWLAHRERH